MSETPKRLRGALALVNLGLLAGISGLGCAAFGSREAFAGPSAFDPTLYAVDPARSALDSRAMGVVWTQLDRPERLPAPAPPPTPAPRAADPSWRLLLANVEPERPERGSGIVVDDLGRQSVVRPGEPLSEQPGYTCLQIQVTGEGQSREAIATLSGPNGLVHLRLRREPVRD